MDANSHAIRMIDVDGYVSTIAGNTTGIPTLSGYVGQQGIQDGPGPQARFFRPYYCASDARGNIYVSDAFNGIIRYLNYTGSPLTGTRKPIDYGTDSVVQSPTPKTYSSSNAVPSFRDIFMMEIFYFLFHF
jgi:hypothetical protein